MSFEEFEKEYGDGSELEGPVVAWKTFEVGVMCDDEPTGDVEEFRREAIHRRRFPCPWGRETWDTNRCDIGFAGWGAGPEDEEWEKSFRKGEVIVMYEGTDDCGGEKLGTSLKLGI